MARERYAGGDGQLLFDPGGRRKYLTGEEGRLFLFAAGRADPETRAFAYLLAYTGCRISEALELTPEQLDASSGVVIFRTLKRRRLCYRAVPAPDGLMAVLLRLAEGRASDQRLWPWCRQTGWRRVKALMATAGIAGAQAMPKGLRHRFGIMAAEGNIPTALAQRWMGHAKPETTAIYQQMVGQEERAMAGRLWRRLPRVTDRA